MANVVQYSEPLVRFLENELRSAFNQGYLRLSRPPHSGGNEFTVQLAEPSMRARLDSGNEQGVIEITTVNKPDTFYLAFAAPFELISRNQYILLSLSLTVFHGVAEELVPMFRAEWDRLDAASSASNHAQPHWHFVQSPECIEQIVRARLSPPSETSEFNPQPEVSKLFSGIADCGKFHFAMTSLWETNDVPPPKRVFDSHDFKKWFAGLTRYIASQLAHLADKMPAASPTFTPQSDKLKGVVR